MAARMWPSLSQHIRTWFVTDSMKLDYAYAHGECEVGIQ